MLTERGKLAALERPCSDLRGSAGGPMLDRATIATGSSSTLANQYLGGFLQLFPELRLLLGKVNDGTSSEY